MMICSNIFVASCIGKTWSKPKETCIPAAELLWGAPPAYPEHHPVPAGAGDVKGGALHQHPVRGAEAKLEHIDHTARTAKRND